MLNKILITKTIFKKFKNKKKIYKNKMKKNKDNYKIKMKATIIKF